MPGGYVRLLRGRGAAADTAVILAGFLVLGVVCGVAWWLLVEPAEFTKTRDGSVMGEVDLTQRFAPDGWYAVVALVAGFATGLVATWRRSRDPRLTTFLVVVGSVVAAAAMAVVGAALGPGDPDAVLASAARGTTAPAALAVSAGVTYLMWPIAVVSGALMVLWSSPGEAQPAPVEPAADDAGAASAGQPTSVTGTR